MQGTSLADILGQLDLGGLADEVRSRNVVAYRDPFSPPYGDPRRTTRWQRLAWAFLKARQGSGPIIAAIGAKGCAKTHFGAGFAFHQGQVFPGSMGCVISNTFAQAKDNAGALFMKMASQLGYRATFRNSGIIMGRPFTSFFVVDLDGTGFDRGLLFYVLVRSFEAVNKLEGIELDWLWAEEVQDAEQEAFVTAFTRVRGQNADQAVFIAGMPHDEFHWQYKLIPALGAREESLIRQELGLPQFHAEDYEDGRPIPVEEYDLAAAQTKGIFFEPSIFENRQNLPADYIPRLWESLDEVKARRWIYGRRTSMRTNKVAYNYLDHVHRTGVMSRMLAKYDPNLPIIVSIDFNTAPMCATVWQEKGWNDAWGHNDVSVGDDGALMILGDDGAWRPLDLNDGLLAPDRTVAAQVDELEVWEGGTPGLMAEFVRRYGDHKAGIVVIGDATGNREDTRSGTTDWRIIEKALLDGDGPVNVSIYKGLNASHDYKKGETKYSNPKRRDTINVLNAALLDAKKRAWICFIPESRLPSGGAAASVAMVENRPDGNVDDSNDKKPGAELPRTHFFDTVRYFVWFFRGGDAADADEFSHTVHALEGEAVVQGSIFGSESGGGWSGVF